MISGVGAIDLSSSFGAIAVNGGITTSGGYVNIDAKNNLVAGNIQTNSGDINLISLLGNVTSGFLNSSGISSGGDIDVQAGGTYKAIASVTIGGKSYSIYTGTTGDRSITIGYGNNNPNPVIPFKVGDASANGTVAAISNGNYTISTNTSFAEEYISGNVNIFSKDTSVLVAALANDGILVASAADINLGVSVIFSPSALSPIQQKELNAFFNQLLDASQPIAEFVLGAVYQWLQENNAPVNELLPPFLTLSKQERDYLENVVLPQSRYFLAGRTLGGGAAIVQGILQFVIGTGAQAGGGGLCITGIGCFGGAPAIAAGAILQAHGATIAANSASETGRLLDELLSPSRMESNSGGLTPPEIQSLAGELGVSVPNTEKALGVISPSNVRNLQGQLGDDIFKPLVEKDKDLIADVSKSLNLIGGDADAINGIKTTFRTAITKPNKLNDGNLKDAFSEMNKFLEEYSGKVSGEFSYRFARANSEKIDKIGARGEINTAEALLKGDTPLGSTRKVKGIPGNEATPGGVVEEFTTPDFLATQTNGITRLVEAKTPTGNVSKTNIKNNLRDAISSIKGSNETTTAKAYVRMDYTNAPSTSLTQNEIFQNAKARLLTPDNNGIKGTEVVEFVEFIYKNMAGQTQKLLIQVQNGIVVIVN